VARYFLFNTSMQGAIAGIQLHATLLFYFLGPDALIADQQQ
jgi:hypothetical protein